MHHGDAHDATALGQSEILDQPAGVEVAVADGVASVDRKVFGPMLLMLPADKLAVITMHSVINVTVNGGDRGAPFTKVLQACLVVAR